MKIEGISLAWLQEQCERHGLELRTDYSGRGMYGKTCVGIVGGANHMSLAQLLIVAALDLDAEGMNWDDVVAAFDDGPGLSSDSMGTDAIFYWKFVQAGEE